MLRLGSFGRLVALAVLVLAHRGGAATASLSPTADTAILQLQPEFNAGAQEDLPVGTLGLAAGATRSRVLLRFDLAAGLPPGAVILGGRLRLTVTRVPDGGGEASVFGLHRLLVPWQEGTGRGGPPGGSKALPGEATWVVRSAGLAEWERPGGLAGVDYVAEASSTERLQLAGPHAFEFGAAQVAELQQWFDHPADNHGWILISEEESIPRTARRIGSREHPEAPVRPSLELDYQVPAVPESPHIRALSVVDGRVWVVFSALPDVAYALEGAASAPAAAWFPVGSAARTNRPGELTLVDESGLAAARFYRVSATR